LQPVLVRQDQMRQAVHSDQSLEDKLPDKHPKFKALERNRRHDQLLLLINRFS
jgi:hypothetical protein